MVTPRLRCQIGVVLLADGLKSADKLRQTFQRIILALHRDEDAVAGAQAVQRQQVEAGRAVDEDKVVILLDGGQRLSQRLSRPGRSIISRLAPARRVLEPITSVRNSVLRTACRASASPMRISYVPISTTPLGNTITGGGVALWVEVYDEHFFCPAPPRRTRG